MNLIELEVPDIGGHENADIIAVEVNIGDTIAVDDTLITLETNKATMDVPAEVAGVIKEVKIKIGDKISEGGLIAIIEAESVAVVPKAEAPAAPAQETPEAAAPAPQATQFGGSADTEYDVVVLGGGPGGYSAAFVAADEDLKAAIVERYKTLGDVCLNVGCIPSKVLLHNVAVIDGVRHLITNGIKYSEPELDIDMLHAYKDGVVSRLTTGLAGMAKGHRIDVVQGNGQFLDPHHLGVSLTTGDVYEQATPTDEKKIIAFKNCVIAAGSHVTKLPFIPEDPHIIDSSGALALKGVPGKLLIIGGGIIGLEMGTVCSTLDSRPDVVEMMDGLIRSADRGLVKAWQRQNRHRFDNIMINTKTVAVEPKEGGVYITFEDVDTPKEPQRYGAVLVAAGHAPNDKLISVEKAGVAVADRGFIEMNKQMCTSVPRICTIGDIVGQPMSTYKAVHEGHVAVENCAGHKAHFDARVIPGVVYTSPEVTWVGETGLSAGASGRKITKANFPWAASGRAIANGCDNGSTRLIFDAETGRIIDGGIVGPNGGDMINEACLAIGMGYDTTDIGRTIHPRPILSESIDMTAEVALSVYIDLPAQKKK